MLRCVMIKVCSVDRAAAFFEAVFGIRPHSVASGPREIVFDLGTVLLSFVEHVWANEFPNAPVVLSMSGNLVEMLHTFEEMRLKILKEPTRRDNVQFVVADSGLGFFVQVIEPVPSDLLKTPPRPSPVMTVQ